MSTDWRGQAMLKVDDLKDNAPTFIGTHRFFQGSSAGIVVDEEKRRQAQAGYAISGRLWRYNPDGSEVRLEDGHGNRLFGN